ncbi:hypothetical protein Vadar_018671 [Vaccinium darrowii]|uniref:Uncharacterized protein n=1 Tax=Vaccinium darrowii TaxID=229202 RepID=A0ACB7XIR8_9ERIC|nr:hypothetical protein Vadar_018671 [Vaccinium darrowii]
MEPEILSKIEETVLQILKTSNMHETTDYKICRKVSEELGLDLSPPDRKNFVRKVVEAYLTELRKEPELDEGKNDAAEGDDEEEEDEDEVEEEGQGKRKRGGGAKEYDDNGDLILCKAFAKHGASSSRGLAKVVKTEKTSSPGAPRPGTTKTRTLQVMLHESDDEGGDKDLIHIPVMETKDVGTLRVEPSQNDVGLDSEEMDEEIIVTQPMGDVFEEEIDDLLRPRVAKVEVKQRSHIETMEEGTTGGEEPTAAEKHHSPVGVTAAGDPTVGNTTTAAGGDAAGDDGHVDTVFKEAGGTTVGASSGSEGPLVKPAAKIRAVSTKTMVSIGAVVGNAFMPVVSDCLLETDRERFTDSFLETSPPQVHASLRVAIPSDYEEDSEVHVTPRVISAFVKHTPSIDQQARHPPLVPCTSRRVVAEPAVLRNVDFEDFASITKSSPLKQAFQTLNEGVGNSLEELVVNQDGSRGSFGRQNPGEFLSSHFQSEIQDEKDQEEDALEDMPTEKMIAGVHIGVKYYPILEEVEQRCPNIFSNLFSVNPWLTYGILVGFANFLKEVRYARVDDFDASKMKTFLLALKEFEQMGLDASWIRLCFEEAQRHNNMRMFAQDLEVAQALILERERKLAELKADLARKKGELAKARRTPTSLAYGDLILKDLF